MTRYRTIVADPPWPLGDFPEWGEGKGTIACPYPTLTLDEIKVLPVATLAEPDAHLYLWTINEHLVPAFAIARVTTFLADAADRAGIARNEVDEYMGTSDMAGWWLSRLEHRSRIPTPEQFAQLKRFLGASDEMDDTYRTLREAERWHGERCDTRWWLWPRRKHSEKPEAFLDVVEQVSPGPYVELFARRDRLGWDTWGDQSLGTAELGGEAA